MTSFCRTELQLLIQNSFAPRRENLRIPRLGPFHVAFNYRRIRLHVLMTVYLPGGLTAFSCRATETLFQLLFPKGFRRPRQSTGNSGMVDGWLRGRSVHKYRAAIDPRRHEKTRKCFQILVIIHKCRRIGRVYTW